MSPARKEELLARDTTVSAKAEELRKEVETLNREQQVIIGRDKEVKTIEKVYPYQTHLLYIPARSADANFVSNTASNSPKNPKLMAIL
jgi:hypothetical protein